jgi:hypothetical protein
MRNSLTAHQHIRLSSLRICGAYDAVRESTLRLSLIAAAVPHGLMLIR